MSSRLVIVGGGPVGLALALATSQLPDTQVTVIERAPLEGNILPEPFDHRVYALSPASLALLHDVGVKLPMARVAKVRAMQVTGDDGHSKLEFDGGAPLASIVEHAVIMQAMQTRLAHDGRVRVLRGMAPVEMLSGGGNCRRLTLSDGRECASDLLIAADGSRSQIRDWAGLATDMKDYDCDGVVANFVAERPHGDIARQWFTRDAVLAYLPLPGNYLSIVWSVRKANSEALSANDSGAFCRAVEQAGHDSLGTLSLVSPIARFPLSRIIADRWVQPGLALIGDAAHAVHPLAGQGVNLGFADVRHLASVLRDRSMFSSVGDLSLLRRYERRAREAAWAIGELTDRLRLLYLNDFATAHWLRNDGIGLLNRLPVAKSLLIDYASG